MDVAVSGRTAEQVEGVAAAIGGRALVGDVSRPEDVERWFAESGPVDLLVANAGTGTHHDDPEWEFDLEKWWRTFEVNVLGVHLCCRAVIPGMLERGGAAGRRAGQAARAPRGRARGSGASDAPPGRPPPAEPAPPASPGGRNEEIMENEWTAGGLRRRKAAGWPRGRAHV